MINFWSVEMSDCWLPLKVSDFNNAEKKIPWKPEIIEAYQKLFTTGFDSGYSIPLNSFHSSNWETCEFDFPADKVLGIGCVIRQRDTVIRVTDIEYKNETTRTIRGKVLEVGQGASSFSNGENTFVLGLGFGAGTKTDTTFNIVDTKSFITYTIDFTGWKTASQSSITTQGLNDNSGIHLIKLTVPGITHILLTAYSPALNSTTNKSAILPLLSTAFRSFVSDGSAVFFNIVECPANSSNNPYVLSPRNYRANSLYSYIIPIGGQRFIIPGWVNESELGYAYGVGFRETTNFNARCIAGIPRGIFMSSTSSSNFNRTSNAMYIIQYDTATSTATTHSSRTVKLYSGGYGPAEWANIDTFPTSSHLRFGRVMLIGPYDIGEIIIPGQMAVHSCYYINRNSSVILTSGGKDYLIADCGSNHVPLVFSLYDSDWIT